MMCLRELPMSNGAGPVGAKHLVATMNHVPLAPQPAPEYLLGDPAGTQVPAQWVRVRRVDEVDAALGGPVEDGACGALVALEPEGHRPQAQPGDLQAGPAQSGVFHDGTVATGRVIAR